MNTELSYEQKAILQAQGRNPYAAFQTISEKLCTTLTFNPGEKIQLGSHVFNSAQLGDLLTILLDQYPELKI